MTSDEAIGELHYWLTATSWDEAPSVEATRLAIDAMKRDGQTCSFCEHWNHEDAPESNQGFCANPNGWHRAKLMPSHEMCSKWEKA